MPRLKEVDYLYKLANRALLSSVVQCCCKLSEINAGDSMGLRKAIGGVKEEILNHIPLNLKPDFLANLMDLCASSLRDESHGATVFEMIMDTEIVGLRLTGRIVRFLRPADAPRFQKLKELDLSHAQSIANGNNYKGPPLDLGKFDLNDLTLIKYPKKCTDSDLEVIGKNCPNLEVLNLYDSENVTDAGMRFLSSCPNLRVVKVRQCPKVTHVSLSFLLSGNKKLEEFSYGYDEKLDQMNSFLFFIAGRGVPKRLEFDMLSGLDFTLQCPSLTHFGYENNRDVHPAVELKAIVTKFPNLTYLRINCIQAEDLSAIKHLNKLTELRVDFEKRSHNNALLSFREALTVIGANLTSLELHDGPILNQGDFNFIFDSCPNLEYLQIDQSPDEQRNPPLVIPPFPKLKTLMFFPREHILPWMDPVDEPILKFGVMSSLETLAISYMRVDYVLLESIMLDNIKFPKLRGVITNSVKPEDLAKFEQRVRDENLDVCAADGGTSYYYYPPTPNRVYTEADKNYAAYVDNYLEACYNYSSSDDSSEQD